MMEDECFQVDIKLATEMVKKQNNSANISYKEFVEKCQQYADLSDTIAKISDELRFLNDAIHIQVLNNPDNEVYIKEIYADRLQELETSLQIKV